MKCKSDRAVELYHGPEKYNCAQAILKTFAKECAISEEIIAEYKAFGGGRAENGYCGALYAAQSLLSEPRQIESLQKCFKNAALSLHCKAIKKSHHLSCKECVRTAAALLDELLQQS